MNYNIRPIQKEDDAAIESVIRACLIEFGGDHEGTAWADPDLCRFSKVYKQEKSRYFVAEDSEGIIWGGVGVGPMPEEGVCELQKMYLLPEARGTGAAQALMDAALTFAQAHYKKCYLETLPNMTAAQRFYEKNGFVRTDKAIGNTGHFDCDVRYIKELSTAKKP